MGMITLPRTNFLSYFDDDGQATNIYAAAMDNCVSCYSLIFRMNHALFVSLFCRNEVALPHVAQGPKNEQADTSHLSSKEQPEEETVIE